MTATLALRLSSQTVQTPQRQMERLYESCRDDVYAYVASLLRDRGQAEEVTALAFERAFCRRRLFDPRRGSERAWLFGIARNAALDELRRRKRLLSRSGAGQPGDVGAEVLQFEGVLLRATVRQALSALTPRERELIALKFHAGLSNREVGRVLGVSESNAGTLLHRTISKLRKACDEQE